MSEYQLLQRHADQLSITHYVIILELLGFMFIVNIKAVSNLLWFYDCHVFIIVFCYVITFSPVK